jgi:hypothetical protein
VGIPDISNNVCGVKGFLSAERRELRGVVSIALWLKNFIDDEGSHVIYRGGISVRPKHLSDRTFDHDYYFELPLDWERDAQSSGR